MTHIFVSVFTGPEEHGVAAAGSEVDEVGHGLSVQSVQDGLDSRKIPLSTGFLKDSERLHALRLLSFFNYNF